jgi:hypothetical protein
MCQRWNSLDSVFTEAGYCKQMGTLISSAVLAPIAELAGIVRVYNWVFKGILQRRKIITLL